MSSFWSAWVIVLTVITFIGMLWVLLANRKTDKAPGETTGHVHDGLEEYDNPMPAWWMHLFLITIVFGIGYLIAYPGMGNFPGLLSWTQEKQWQQEVEEAQQRYGAIFAKYAAVPVEELATDKKALKMGRRMFANNCAQCHGADARGAFGFPNLADNDWLYGGSADQIRTSIVDGRNGIMPGWEAPLGAQGITEVAAYVLSLSGQPADAALVAAGEPKYQMYCLACHGADGTGNQMLGAPNLADDIWLYEGSEEQVRHSIRVGRNAEMPAHGEILSENKIHLLTAYVYSLSHVAKAPSEAPPSTN